MKKLGKKRIKGINSILYYSCECECSCACAEYCERYCRKPEYESTDENINESMAEETDTSYFSHYS